MIFVFVKNSDIKREYKSGTVLYVFTRKRTPNLCCFSPLSVHLPQDNNFVSKWNVRGPHSEAKTQRIFICNSTPQSITSSRFPSNASDFRWVRVQRPKCPFILCEAYCWLFILSEKMFIVSESRPILLMKILYNAVKRLRDGFASRHLSALSAIYTDSSNAMTCRS